MNAMPPHPHSPTRRRLARGFEALLAPFRPVANAPAETFLHPNAYVLFRNMSRADRSHSIRVYYWLLEQGYDHPDLLTAGLLHDCGKAAAHLAVWQRTLKVLLKKLTPELWRRLSEPTTPEEWRYPFFILAEHARIGAEWAGEAGCSELTCWLIANHESDIPPDHPQASLLRALQYADAAS